MKKANQKTYTIAGFTLLELLVAITIMMVITAIGVVSYATVTKRARNTRRVSDIEQVRQALEMYRSDNGFYPVINEDNPTAIDGENGLGTVLQAGDYLQKTPVDPKEGSYNYTPGSIDASGVQAFEYCVSGLLEQDEVEDPGTCSALPSGDNFGYGNP